MEASHDPGSCVWIGLHEPSPEECEAVRHELGLHELAVEDAVAAHQRPKLEVYDSDLFVVLKPAHYDDATEAVDMAEIQVFVGESYVVTVRHGDAGALRHVRAAIERDLERIRCGPMAVLPAGTDRVVADSAASAAVLATALANVQ